MIRKLCCLIVPVFLGSTIASAQVTLQQKYTEGTKLVVHSEQKSTQTLTLVGMDIDTKGSTFIIGSTTIGKRAADGSLDVEEKVTSMQSEISLPGGLMISFDSANPDKKAPIPELEPILDALRAASRTPMTLELDAQNKIRRVRLPDGEFDKLPESAKDRFKPEWLQKSVEQAIAFLPSEPVKKGDTWERSTESNLGEGQIMSFRTKYEYLGTIEKDGMMLDKIVGKVLDVTYAINGNPTLQVKNSDLKVIETTGAYLFDRARGTTISRSSKVRMSGPLTIVINNMELPGKVDLTIEDSASLQNNFAIHRESIGRVIV